MFSTALGLSILICAVSVAFPPTRYLLDPINLVALVVLVYIVLRRPSAARYVKPNKFVRYTFLIAHGLVFGGVVVILMTPRVMPYYPSDAVLIYLVFFFLPALVLLLAGTAMLVGLAFRRGRSIHGTVHVLDSSDS